MKTVLRRASESKFYMLQFGTGFLQQLRLVDNWGRCQRERRVRADTAIAGCRGRARGSSEGAAGEGADLESKDKDGRMLQMT